MSGVDSPVEQGIADPDCLEVMGWSYGGFLMACVIGSRNTLLTYFGGTPRETAERVVLQIYNFFAWSCLPVSSKRAPALEAKKPLSPRNVPDFNFATLPF